MLKSGSGASRPGQSVAPRLAAVAAAAALLCFHAGAQTPAPAAPVSPAPAASASTTPVVVLTLKDAVQQAVLTNPEVLARWHTIKAAEGERDAARGGLLPRLDLSAAVGPERRTDLDRYSRHSTSVSLTQLLYDGFATRSEVRRLDHAARVRLFEFFEVSENVALEATRAYFDVMRYRELVRLAEDNFVDHRAVFSQTERRVNAKVARGVDLEQVSGRLALAEANLLTEAANLHDTTARFQRMMGRLPTRDMSAPPHLARDIAPDAVTAITQAQQRNPSLLAAIENVRASQAALATRTGSYVPRLDARVRRDQGRNHTGSLGSSSATAAELVLSWNLFNGFTDRSRERQFAEQLNVAKDVRDKTCRDIRQTLIIAHNDVRKLTEQLEYLIQHEKAVGKALAAYRQQYDIGQRSLLDLLDTENELFQARRAVVGATHDLHLAYARTQAGQGTLLRAMELAHLDTGAEADLASWNSGGDAAQNCPPEPITASTVDKPALMQRAAQTASRMSMLNLKERAVAEVAVGATAAPEGQAGTPDAKAAEQAVKDALEAWRAAWASRNIDTYLAAYSPEFTPAAGVTREAWEKRRRGVIGRAADVEIEISSLVTKVEGADRAVTSFTQQYRSASYRDSVTKTMEWKRVDGRWMIVSESAGN